MMLRLNDVDKIQIPCTMSMLTLTLNFQLRLIYSIYAAFFSLLLLPLSTFRCLQSFGVRQQIMCKFQKNIVQDKRHLSHVETETRRQSNRERDIERTHK